MFIKNIKTILCIAVLAFTAGACTNLADDIGKDNKEDLTVVTKSAIEGVTEPADGEIPVTKITECDQYTGTVSWSPADDTFKAGTIYTATITLTAKSGYTFKGVASNFFTVKTATATNPADSGVVTAVFPDNMIPKIPKGVVE